MTKSTKNSLGLSPEELNAEINARAKAIVEQTLAEVHYFRHPLSRTRTPTIIEGEDMAHQSHKDSVDINNIIRQFDRTGHLPPSDKIPFYDDVSELNKPLSELAVESQARSAQFKQDVQDYNKVMDDKKKAEAQKSQEPSVPPSSPPTAPVPPTETDS